MEFSVLLTSLDQDTGQYILHTAEEFIIFRANLFIPRIGLVIRRETRIIVHRLFFIKAKKDNVGKVLKVRIHRRADRKEKTPGHPFLFKGTVTCPMIERRRHPSLAQNDLRIPVPGFIDRYLDSREAIGK